MFSVLIMAVRILLDLTSCKKCKKTFKTTAGLATHSKFECGLHKCPECQKCFRDSYALNRHCKIHETHKNNISMHCLTEDEFNGSTDKIEKIICVKCKKTFKTSSGLATHIKFECGQHKCNECQKLFRDSYALNRHSKIHEAHRNNNVITLHFATEGEFFDWKNKTEKENNSYYVKHRASKMNKDGTNVTRYYCHRDGNYKPQGKSERTPKLLGSNKLNDHCPSYMQAYTAENGVRVRFNPLHLNHSCDVDRLNLTIAEKQQIAEFLELQIPMKEILEHFRGTLTNKQLERINLITRKDLHNISKQLVEETHDQNEFGSIVVWATRGLELGEVRFYKPLGAEGDNGLATEDLLLIVANEAQLNLFHSHGNDIVCIDRTHDLNSNDLKLITLLVLDDRKRWFPCAYMISNRTDSFVMEVFFRVMRDVKNEEIYPQYFMSDMTENFCNAWKNVYPAELTQRLYCSWDVEKEWKKNLANKIKGVERQAEVYKMIKMLMYERDEAICSSLCKQVMKIFESEKDTSEFVVYFRKFINDPKPWASCYRKNMCIKTNRALENLHKTLQDLYLKGKKLRRLDRIIHDLMRYAKEKFLDRSFDTEEELSIKLADLRLRHIQSTEMTKEGVKNVSLNRWQVPSRSSTEIYVVAKGDDVCYCKLRCEDCNECIHAFSCTCYDNCIAWNMCKHVHLIATMFQTGNYEYEEEFVETVAATEIVFEENLILSEIVDNNESVIVCGSSHESASLVEEEKEKELEKLYKQITDVVDTAEDLDIAKSHTNRAYTVIQNSKRICSAALCGNNEPPNKKLAKHKKEMYIKDNFQQSVN